MTDVFTKEKRQEIMSLVKGKDTKPEIIVRKIIHRMGFRFRLHRKDLPGKPDITLPKHNKVIFVHGCFWHQHEGCKRSKRPKAHKDFWDKKLERNIERDKNNILKILQMNWIPLVVWECETKNIEELTRKLKLFLEG